MTLSTKSDTSNQNFFFYLQFDASHDKEIRRWQRFLQANGVIPNSIYLSKTEGGYNAWLNMVKRFPAAQGVMIVHEDKSRDFGNLPSLGSTLLDNKKRVHVFCANLSRSMKTWKGQVRFTELFPQGGAVLITEKTILRDGHKVLAVLDWFSNHTRIKTPGT